MRLSRHSEVIDQAGAAEESSGEYNEVGVFLCRWPQGYCVGNGEVIGLQASLL